MSLISGKVFFWLGRKLYSYENESLSYITTNELPNAEYQFSGRSTKDIFFAMKDGITHFNGTNIEYIYKFGNSNLVSSGMLVFEKDIIVLALDFSRGINFIIRGKLQ